MDIGMDTSNQQKGKTAIWCITPNGLDLAKKISDQLGGSVVFVSNKLAPLSKNEGQVGFNRLSTAVTEQFNRFSGHIFIAATGIVVRMIAPHLVSKISDPAVVVIDDQGSFAISLVSGHLGGANQLAQRAAAIIDARPVITTATDCNNLPAIDMIAKECGLHIETPENIKCVNMALLTATPLRMHDPMEILKGKIPGKHLTLSESVSPGICHVFCSHRTEAVPRETLILRPRILSVGIGCNRGTSHEEIEKFLKSVLDRMSLSLLSVCRLGTTEVKKDEQGLLSLGRSLQIPLDFYTKQELNSVAGIKTPSKMAQKYLGVKSVCEAAAILSADGGELLVTKQKNKDVTVAVAMKK